MAFVNPLYLWAFLGLAVPVAIHLWSRKEGRTIKLGSIKFLTESVPKQASSIRLNEIWLLILRILALSILVLILAEPVLKNENSRATLTYLIEPSLLQHDEMLCIIDTINLGTEVKLLAADFPTYSKGDEVTSGNVPDYWQLVKKFEELYSDSIVVFTAAYVAGFKGRRPQTDQNINWIQISPDENVNAHITALRKGEELEIISISGNHTRLEIKKEVTPLDNKNITDSEDSIILDPNGDRKYIPLRTADTLRVSLFNDGDLEDQKLYVESSLRAISEYVRTPLKITELSEKGSVNDEEDLVVWISNSAVIETGSPVLIWKPDSLANSMIEEGIERNEYYLTSKLNSENIVEEHLPEQLFKLLNINNELGEKVAKYDHRVMPLEEIFPGTGSRGRKIESRNSSDLTKYFWVLLIILLVAERGLSYSRKQ